MSLLYNDDFIFKFINIYIHIYLYHLYVKVVISYWSYLYFSVDVKDSCCLLSPTNDSTFSLTEDLSLLPGIRYILSQDFVSVISTFFYEFSAFIQALDLAVWTLRFNKNLPQPEWMCCGKLLGTFNFPCVHNYFTCGGTDWSENYKIRCRTTSDVKNRLSPPACRSKMRKKKTKKNEYPT